MDTLNVLLTVGFFVVFLALLVGFFMVQAGGPATPDMIVTGPRVGLRQLVVDDQAEVLLLRPDGATTSSGEFNEESIELGIVDPGSESVIGVVSFRPADRAHEHRPAMEFDIIIRVDLHGQGIGAEATALAIGWMLDAGCKRVIAGCSRENAPMVSILERLAGEPYHRGPFVLRDDREVSALWFAFDDGGPDPTEPEAESVVESG